MSLSVSDLVKQSHATAREKGWWDQGNPNLMEKLMLIVTEVGEVAEEHRAGHLPAEVYWPKCSPCACAKDGTLGVLLDHDHSGKPEGVPIELADVLIRIGDLCGYYGIDLEEAVRVKHAYNQTRPRRHGGKTC